MRERRAGLLMSQARLGELVGLDASAIARIEGGGRGVQLTEAVQIAKALTVPLGQLLSTEPSTLDAAMREAKRAWLTATVDTSLARAHLDELGKAERLARDNYRALAAAHGKGAMTLEEAARWLGWDKEADDGRTAGATRMAGEEPESVELVLGPEAILRVDIASASPAAPAHGDEEAGDGEHQQED